MKKAIKLTLVYFSFFLISLDANAFIDDIWQEYTPNKNIIGNNEDGRGIYLNYPNNELHNLREWYFYKNHILGSFYAEASLKYFILNEDDGTLKTFEGVKDFNSYTSETNLTPMIKRVYNHKWSLFPKESSLPLGTLMVFYIIFAFPVFCLFLLSFALICFILYFLGALKDFIQSTLNLLGVLVKTTLWISLYCIPIILITWFIKGIFPQSI